MLLTTMQQSATVLKDRAATPGWTPEPSSIAGFAGLLSTLVASPSSAAENTRAWPPDGLDDDVATLSYESALRANARYKPPAMGVHSLPRTPDTKLDAKLDAKLNTKIDTRPDARLDTRTDSSDKQPSGDAALPVAEASSAAAQKWAGDKIGNAALDRPATLERSRKRASITIRLSEEECEQLHKRAAEAGLTVSAYLRSCTIEAEALRAQVKEALAGLRTAAVATERQEKPRRQWWLRLWPHVRLHAPLSEHLSLSN
jgi:predicted DNA binding CopG/RHH family protein